MENQINPIEGSTSWICKPGPKGIGGCLFQGQTSNGMPPSDGCPVGAGGQHNWVQEQAVGPSSNGEFQCTICDFFGSDVNTPPTAGCPGPIQNPSVQTHQWNQINGTD